LFVFEAAPEAPGGRRRGESVCWELRTLPNQVTAKKNFKPWERFPTKYRRYSPF
jgi:hypothetical protein